MLYEVITAEFIRNLFSEAYLKHQNLTDATRFLTNALFSEYGLVIIDGNDAALKRLLIPYIKDDLLNSTSYNAVTQTIEKINSLPNHSYSIQVNPREINLFYLRENLRERIVFEDGKYSVVNHDVSWTKEGILGEVENYPERFSPNVIMRPLYQEVILPNLCYIGGGGELAYWFELKQFFNSYNFV